MQDRFVYTAHPSRVVFGAGSLAALADEVKALGCRRAFVLTTPQQEAAGAVVVAQLGPLRVVEARVIGVPDVHRRSERLARGIGDGDVDVERDTAAGLARIDVGVPIGCCAIASA